MKSNPTKPISLKYDDVYHEVFAHENVRKQFLSDVLEFPLESIRTVQLLPPRLWKRYRRQKLGILDMALELSQIPRSKLTRYLTLAAFAKSTQLTLCSCKQRHKVNCVDLAHCSASNVCSRE